METMSPQQCRAARKLLGNMTQDALGLRCGLSETQVYYFENKRVSSEWMAVPIQRTLEAAGARFLFSEDGEPNGVMLAGHVPVITDDEPDDDWSITALHFRVARAWLDWTHDRVAAESGASLSTLRDFEKDRHYPRPENLVKIELAIKMMGIRFLFDDVNGLPIGIVVKNGALSVAA